MSFKGIVLTNQGKILLNKAHESKIFKLKCLRIGDGFYTDDHENCESVVHSLFDVPININRENNKIIIDADVINYEQEECYMREIAIIALDENNNEIVYAYDNAGNDAEILARSSQVIYETRLRFYFIIENDISVHISVSSNMYALNADLQVLNSKLDKMVLHPNLIINADFSNCINQRAMNEYGQMGDGTTQLKTYYTIDRWCKGHETTSIIVCDDYVRFKSRVGTDQATFGQALEFPKMYAGKTLTLSCKIKEIVGSVEFGLFYGSNNYLSKPSLNSININATGIHHVTVRVPENFNEDLLVVLFYMHKELNQGDYVDIEWVKLEHGEVATPFIPRLRGEELQLCQRFYENFLHSMYCIVPTNTSKVAAPLMGFKVKKRTIPKVTTEGFYSHTNSATKLAAEQESVVVSTIGITYIQLTEAVGATMCYVKNLEIDSEIYFNCSF